MFVGMIHNKLPSYHNPLEGSSDKNSATSSAGECMGSPGAQGCNVVTSTDPSIAAPVLESTPALQTIPMVMVQMAAN
jgi:hypothetical protein